MSDRKLPVSPRRGCDRDKPRTRIEDESAIEEVYKMGDVLGRGSFGVVKEVTNRADGRQYAMKIINKDKVIIVKSVLPCLFIVTLDSKTVKQISSIRYCYFNSNHFHRFSLVACQFSCWIER